MSTERRRKKRDVADVHEVIDNMADKNVTVEEGLTRVVDKIFTYIDELQEEVDNILKPKGTRANPAMHCRDIFLAHPDFKDGKCDRRKVKESFTLSLPNCGNSAKCSLMVPTLMRSALRPTTLELLTQRLYLTGRW